MKLKPIGDDGSIQGWAIAGLLTLSRLIIYILDYIVPGLADIENKIGASFTTFALTSVASWFTYKLIKPNTTGG